jgi:hypothetical protein
VKIVPKRNQVLGRIADLTRSEGGIELPATDVRGVTIFVFVDAVGPDVIGYRPGDIVVPEHVKHIWLRGGRYHRVIFKDEVIVAVIEDLPKDQFEIEGERSGQVGLGATA